MEIEEIKTKRMVLRVFTPDLYRLIFTNFTKSEELLQALNFTSIEELELERDKHFKGTCTYNKSFVKFKLIATDSNLPIGNCHFHTWYLQHQRAEIGYDLFNEAYKRKGYMSEAMEAVLHYGFTRMNLNRFGFSKEGYLREHHKSEEVFHDSFIFSLLKKEFESNQTIK